MLNLARAQSPALRDLNLCVTFFSAKAHSAFHPSEVGKYSTEVNLRWINVQRESRIIQKLEISAAPWAEILHITSMLRDSCDIGSSRKI